MNTERDGRNVFHRSPVDSPDITSSPMPTVPCNVVGVRIPIDPTGYFVSLTPTFFHDHLGDGKGGQSNREVAPSDQSGIGRCENQSEGDALELAMSVANLSRSPLPPPTSPIMGVSNE